MSGCIAINCCRLCCTVQWVPRVAVWRLVTRRQQQQDQVLSSPHLAVVFCSGTLYHMNISWRLLYPLRPKLRAPMLVGRSPATLDIANGISNILAPSHGSSALAPKIRRMKYESDIMRRDSPGLPPRLLNIHMARKSEAIERALGRGGGWKTQQG